MSRTSSRISGINLRPWWRSAVEDFTNLSASELPEGVVSGTRFTAIAINVPRHLQYLLASFQNAGGKLLKSRLSTQTDRGFPGVLESARVLVQGEGPEKISVFVNATGIGARALVGDETVFPTKGQTVLVKGEVRFVKATDQDHYVIPRPGSGTTILGGTRENWNW